MTPKSKPTRRFSAAIAPRLYDAAQVVAKSRSQNVGDVLDEALAQHPDVQRALGAMQFVDANVNQGVSKLPDSHEGKTKPLMRSEDVSVHSDHGDDDLLGELLKDGGAS